MAATLEPDNIDPEGNFSLGGLRPVPYSVCAGSWELGWAVATGVQPGTEDLTLAVRPAGYLDLMIKDAAGLPVEGAFATVVSVSKAPVVVPAPERFVSDATGRLRIAVPAGALEVSIFSQVYKQLLEVEVEPAGTVHMEVKLSTPRGLPR